MKLELDKLNEILDRAFLFRKLNNGYLIRFKNKHGVRCTMSVTEYVIKDLVWFFKERDKVEYKCEVVMPVRDVSVSPVSWSRLTLEIDSVGYKLIEDAYNEHNLVSLNKIEELNLKLCENL